MEFVASQYPIGICTTLFYIKYTRCKRDLACTKSHWQLPAKLKLINFKITLPAYVSKTTTVDCYKESG